MEDSVLDKIKLMIEKSKGKESIDRLNVTLTSGGVDSLSKIIKTKQQADDFMRSLKAL